MNNLAVGLFNGFSECKVFIPANNLNEKL